MGTLLVLLLGILLLPWQVSVGLAMFTLIWMSCALIFGFISGAVSPDHRCADAIPAKGSFEPSHRGSPLLRELRHHSDKAIRAMRARRKYGFLSYGPSAFFHKLESTLPRGMNYEQARRAGWHIDHIVPLSRIANAVERQWGVGKAAQKRAIRIAMDLDNLQMLPGEVNMSKGDHWGVDPQQEPVLRVLAERYA